RHCLSSRFNSRRSATTPIRASAMLMIGGVLSAELFGRIAVNNEAGGELARACQSSCFGGGRSVSGRCCYHGGDREMLLICRSKDTATVVAALGKHVRKLPQELRRSLTWDRGKEMADHKNFTVATNVQVYFCDLRSPWQRGSNENTNGLLRQYFPRGTDLSRFSQAYLNRIALRLNQRPRKTLGFETPADRLGAVLQ